MSRVTRRLWAAFWVVLALLVIVLALVVTAARLMLPEAGRYRPRVEQWASTVVGRPVKISRLRAEWKGIRPAFRLYDVRLLNRQGDRTRLRFSQVRVTIAPLASLLSGTPTPSSVSLTGARLSIQRRADGGLSVAGLGYGAPNGTAPRAGLSPIEALLLGQRRIALESSEIVWQDLRRRAAPLRFTGVNLTLHNDGDRHRLEASATLPASLGQRFKLAMDVTGDVNAPKGWSGTLDVEGSALHMAQWLRDGALKPVRVLGGAADLVLHSRWRQGRLEALRGDVALRRLRVETTPLAGGPASSPGGKPAPPRRLDLAALSGNFTWQRAGQGWRLQVNHFALTRDGRTWPSSAFSLAVGAETAGIRSVSGEFDYLQLQDVAAALQAVPQLPAEVRRGLTALRPHGELRGVKFSYLGSGGFPERFSVQARFQGLATRAWHKIPAVQGLAGRVQGDQHSGTLVLNSRKVRLEFPRVFRAPLNLDQLAGDVRWRSLQGGLLEIDGTGLQAGNRDVRQVKAGLRLEIPGHGAPPRLDMLATFAHGDVAGVFRYLPVSIMPKPSVEWLDRALVSGRVRSGEVVFRGPVTDFPFDNGRGQFEVGFNLHDTVLAYRPGWPSIQGMKAHVLFSGRSMVIDADAGTISGAAIKRVHAAIPDLQHPVLSVQGTADGPVQNMLQFLRESPLASHYSDFLRDVTATGNGALNLDMRIPLSPEPNRIKGAVQFSDNALTLKRWGVDFTDLDGMLDFNESGVSAQSLSARYRGYPVRIAVDTLGPAGQRTTRIDVDGRLSVPALVGQSDPVLARYFSGASDWRLSVLVPAATQAGTHPRVRLHVESDLAGTAVRLPAPLGKPAREPRPLVVDTELAARGMGPVSLRYGRVLNGILELQRGPQGLHVTRGQLRFGGGAPALPSRPGVMIAGKLPSLDLGQWQTLLFLPTATGTATRTAASTSTSIAPLVTSVDLRVRELRAFGIQFHALRVQAQREAQRWLATVDSRELAGSLQVPLSLSSGSPLVMDLKRLIISAAPFGGAGRKPMDPRDIPALLLQCQQLKYGGANLGRVTLRISRSAGGLSVDRFTMLSPTLQADASGAWTVAANGQQVSQFKIKLTSADLGQALSALGYVSAISGGKTQAEFDGQWPGSPLQFSSAHLTGTLHLDVGEGRLLDVEPGVGRVFGLLSLQALPRRLSLDFSDLFRKGLSFDHIKGDFTFKHGDAYTSNLTMTGPSAEMRITGRTGLVAKDYDQVVTVVPNITASLPIAGALAGGPAVGAVLFLTQKLFQHQINDITRYRYTVTGPWNKPVVKRVSS